jgi:hypothetical protein
MCELETIGAWSEDPEKREESIWCQGMLRAMSLFAFPHYFVILMRLDPDDVKAADAKSEERRWTSMLTSLEVRAILEKYCNENDLISVDATGVTLDAHP